MNDQILQLLDVAFVTFLYGAVGSAILIRGDRLSAFWGSALALMGSAAGAIAGVFAIMAPNATVYNLETYFPSLTISLHVDKLSGIFLIIIGVIGVLATIYGHSYMKHYEGKYRLGSFYFFYNLFLASMMLVVVANQALFFLLAWELMALASYFLVVFDHREEANVRAGYLYFIVTHIATAFIILLSFIFYKATGSFDFDIWRAQSGSLSTMSAMFVFICALIGFGTKAGVIPLHIWLPKAHPAAPSQISALMSGVMIKLGIYMLIRVFMDFFLQTPTWLGITVLLLGSLSSVLGVLYALGEHDIKRLLAYHSIENIGIILLGLGAALVFRSMGVTGLSALALAASLFHILNHAVFKSLLFLSAGAVVQSTNTRNMEQYGGLIKRMPYTALYFLVGSIAISGIIPFNGFVSEWLTFRSMFGGIALSSVAVKSIFTFGIAALALTGGLAAACFVKAFGVTFLARPRSERAIHAHESDISMNVPMGTLAALTLLLGLLAGPVAKIFMMIASGFTTFENPDTSTIFLSKQGALILQNGSALLNMPILFMMLSAALLITWLFTHLIHKENKVERKITWDCGFPLTPRMEITGTAFAHSIVTIFSSVLKPTEQRGAEYHDADQRYFMKSQSVHIHLDDVYMKYCYTPLANITIRCAGIVRRIQSGNVHAYILYVLLTLIVLLALSI